jgi:hypothetical protein
VTQILFQPKGNKMTFYSFHNEARDIYRQTRQQLKKEVELGLVNSDDIELVFQKRITHRLEGLGLSTPKSWANSSAPNMPQMHNGYSTAGTGAKSQCGGKGSTGTNPGSGTKKTDGEHLGSGTKSDANGNPGAKAKPSSNSKSDRSRTEAAAGAVGLVAEIAAGAAVVATSVASGLGTAYEINKHVLNDDESLDQDERDARKSGRIGSYAGGGAGAAGAVTMVCAAGEVGLGVTGVSTGLTAIGATVGGGAATGTVIALVVPALAACAVAGFSYGGYKLYQWLSKSGGNELSQV